MKRLIASSAALVIITTASALALTAAQTPAGDDRQALRARIEERYDAIPLSDGIALRPKSPAAGGPRLVVVADTITIDGVAVSGRELRERLGADADAILRLSYLDASDRRALFLTAPAEGQPRGQPAIERERPLEQKPPEAPERAISRSRQSHGDRVRIFGDVTVASDEAVTGQVVAVIGSVRIDGKVGDQVVAVLGSVDLGPEAVVGGDVVAVGGRVRRADSAQVRGGVTEVSLVDGGRRIHVEPWFDGWGPFYLFDGFGAVSRLIGSTFRFVLLALLASIAFIVARRPVEGSAERVMENPVKVTLVGLAAWLLSAPVFLLIAVVLAISIIGIPLLLLLPFAVLVLLLMALVGFSGTAYAVGQWARRRFGVGAQPAVVDVCLGVFVILLPVLVARVLGLVGWPISPLAFLLLAIGLAVEFLAWSSGFGAVLTNAFTRWQTTRMTRASAQTPPAVP
jgi:hypothetical protein